MNLSNLNPEFISNNNDSINVATRLIELLGVDHNNVENKGAYNKLCTDHTLFKRSDEEKSNSGDKENENQLCQHQW